MKIQLSVKEDADLCQCKAVIEKAGAEVCVLFCKAEICQLDY